MRTPRLIVWNPCRQRVLSGLSPARARAKPRASCTMKRELMPSGQAGMQLPLPLHTEAQRTASALPLPPVIRSTIPAEVSTASASPSPAGATIGHARKQAPQRVQASAIASPRALKSSRYPPASVLSFMPPPSLFLAQRLPHRRRTSKAEANAQASRFSLARPERPSQPAPRFLGHAGESGYPGRRRAFVGATKLAGFFDPSNR